MVGLEIGADDYLIKAVQPRLLLAILAKQSGKILSRDEIMQQPSGNRYDGLDRTIDNKISSLRKKLGDNSGQPNRIRTVRLKGYVLVPGAWKESTAK